MHVYHNPNAKYPLPDGAFGKAKGYEHGRSVGWVLLNIQGAASFCGDFSNATDKLRLSPLVRRAPIRVTHALNVNGSVRVNVASTVNRFRLGIANVARTL